MSITPLSPLETSVAMLGLFLRDHPAFYEKLGRHKDVATIYEAIAYVKDEIPQHTPDDTFARLILTVVEEYTK